MIYASDLDQTLIYSQRSIGAVRETNEIITVESVDQSPRSFMTKRAFEQLKEIAARIDFVPVTTRTIEQYQRITCFREALVPKCAITSNGGNILIAGKIDHLWNQIMTNKLTNTSACHQDIRAEFDKLISSSWVLSEKLADNLFYSFMIDRENMPLQEIVDFTQYAGKQGWEVSVQERKLYLVPNGVSKRDALIYVKELFNSNYLIASGDSLLDQCMQECTNLFIAPGHGELYRKYQLDGQNKGIVFTESSGIYASEEILQKVLESIYINEEVDISNGQENLV